MKNIKYKTGKCRCLTKCPYGLIYNKDIILVSSWNCSHKPCSYFVSIDINKKIVKCKYEEVNK